MDWWLRVWFRDDFDNRILLGAVVGTFLDPAITNQTKIRRRQKRNSEKLPSLRCTLRYYASAVRYGTPLCVIFGKHVSVNHLLSHANGRRTDVCMLEMAVLRFKQITRSLRIGIAPPSSTGAWSWNVKHHTTGTPKTNRENSGQKWPPWAGQHVNQKRDWHRQQQVGGVGQRNQISVCGNI